jgi:hypothetical protein
MHLPIIDTLRRHFAIDELLFHARVSAPLRHLFEYADEHCRYAASMHFDCRRCISSLRQRQLCFSRRRQRRLRAMPLFAVDMPIYAIADERHASRRRRRYLRQLDAAAGCLRRDARYAAERYS